MYIKYVYIFSHKVYLCKRNTIMIKYKVQPKFPLTFLIFEYCNFYLLKLIFIFFCFLSGETFIFHILLWITLFLSPVEEILDFTILVTLTTLLSQLYLTLFLCYVVTNVSGWLNSTNIDWAPPLSQALRK